MFYDKLVNIILILALTIYFVGYFNLRYFSILPTVKVYPDNDSEILIVNNYVNENNIYYLELFKETDESVVNVFKKIVDLPREEMDKIIYSPHLIFITLLLKTIINRARPIQVNPKLKIQESFTANTPAYPSGHCIQAYYLAKKLSVMYPDKEYELFKLAEDCAMARVHAGLHYPSDNEFGKLISLNIL